jgi:hypothetical protein
MRWLQRMTVRAQDAEIFESVIVAITVDVIELDGNSTVRRTFGPAA